jgi:hypothetical protein
VNASRARLAIATTAVLTQRLWLPTGVQDHGDANAPDELQDLPAAARCGGVERGAAMPVQANVPGGAREPAQQQDLDGVGDVATCS